jgi:uncharacterized cupin superfamily protein
MVLVRLRPYGPGLAGLEKDPATPLDALAPDSLVPDERSQCAATTPAPLGELSVGTWAASEHTCKMAPYPMSEFCFILEGAVHIRLEDGTMEVFNAGDAFWIEAGTVLEWKQLGNVRKYFVIHQAQRAKL